MSLITRNSRVSKYDCTINVTKSTYCNSCCKRSLLDFLSLRHPNHLVLAVANNRNVIISYRFLAAPVQENRDFFWHTDCIFQLYVYTRELLECLLGISPSGRNTCGGNKYRCISLFFLLSRLLDSHFV